MRDWIVGYEKGATQKSPGVSEQEWADAQSSLGDAPEELSDLYMTMNGATFQGGVHLFPVHAEGPHRGVMEESRISVAGLPDSGVWRFGEKASKHLFAIKKSDAVQMDGAPEYDWLNETADDEWIYGVRDELTQVLKFYATLENLLSTLVPPAESEEFGERTYARAMTLVQSALDGLDEAEGEDGADDDSADESDDDDVDASDAGLDEDEGETPARIRGDDEETPEAARPLPKAKPAPAAKKAPAKKAAKPAKKSASKKPAAAKKAGKPAKAAKKAAKPAAKKKPVAKGKKAAPKKVAKKVAAKKPAKKAAKPAAKKKPLKKAQKK